MTARRITLRVDRVRLTGAQMSRADLSVAIHAQLGAALRRHGATLMPVAGTIAVVDGGRTTPTTPARRLDTGVAQAVARAAITVLTR